jgi:hypothetical protein
MGNHDFYRIDSAGQAKMLIRPNLSRSSPIDRNVPVNATLAIVLAIEIIMAGCTTRSPVPDAATGSINVPVRFVSVSGDEISVNDRPANATAMFGVIPGAIFGAPNYSLQTERLGKISTLPVNLSELRTVLNQQSATITADASAAGWKIDPADTRFARVATTISHEGTRTGPLMIGFVDSTTKKNLLLIFFDRPCRLTGTVVIRARDGATTTFAVDVTVNKTGLNWLEMASDGAGHDVIVNARVPPSPLFVVAPLENLKQRLIQIR